MRDFIEKAKQYFSEEEQFDYHYSSERWPRSGWKLHVFGKDYKDSARLYVSVDYFLYHNLIDHKYATDAFFDACGSSSHRQFGKSLTVVLSLADIAGGSAWNIPDQLQRLLDEQGYESEGVIRGDR
jgi:lysozyme family protein